MKTRISIKPWAANVIHAAAMIAGILVSPVVLSQELIKDINQNENPEVNEYNVALDVNNTLFYTAGSALWRSTGTRSSTIRLKSFQGIGSLTSVAGMLYFSANDGSGFELWKSNGTPSGTVRVKDIFAGSGSSNPDQLVAVGTTVFFMANNGVTGRELWKSNGTATGTVLVKDIMRVSGGSGGSSLTNVNGVLYFAANDGQHGYELWKSDGTTVGTVMVKDIRSGVRISSSPRAITNINGVAFFTADDGTTGRELWKSNGTAAGTSRVKDLISGSASTAYHNFTAVGNTLFFSANDKIHGEELWKSDGTSTGTFMVKDLSPGPRTSGHRGDYSYRMNNFRNINGKLYFQAYKNNDFYNWKSDGTEAGTIAFAPSNGVGIYQTEATYTFYNNSVFFYNGSMKDDIITIELMKEDPSGQVFLVTTLYLNDYYATTTSLLLKSGNYLYLTGRRSPQEGHALFRSNGTASGTQLLIDNISVKDQSSNPARLITIADKTYFVAAVAGGTGVWVTDGTTVGTRLLATVGGVSIMINANGKLAFVGWDGSNVHIYTSDGTIAGTTKLEMVAKPPESTFMTEMIFINGKFIFILRGPNYDSPYRLWFADTNTSGDLGEYKFAYGLTPVGSTVYFGGEQAITGAELWKTNGTAAGTQMVEDILPGATGSWPTSMTSYKNQLYFSASDSVHGFELWRSNGTPSGTLMLKNISTTNQITGYAGLHNFLKVNNILYFTYDDAVDGWLWKTDGTAAGTSMIKKVQPIYRMIDGKDRLYFLSFAGTFELWSSQGTLATTQMVTDWGGIGNFQLDSDYAMMNSTLYVNDTQGRLFLSDGTPCGSFQVPTTVTFPTEFEALGSNLIFSGFRADIGQELFRLNTTNIALPACFDLASSAGKMASVYPNPFSDDFTVQLNGVEGESYQVEVIQVANYSMITKHQLQYNKPYRFGRQFTQGTYILKIIDGKTETVKRMVKQQ
jgi:ELWxxDGT repeat protein